MDEVPVTRLGGTGRVAARATAITAILIGIAIVKPWGAAPPAPSLPDRAALAGQARATLRAGDDPLVPADPIVEHCLDPSGWRVFAHERWARRTIRSWKSVVPVTEATGPTDPAIPSVLVATSRLPGLGYCAPPRGGERPPPEAMLTVWRIADDGSTWRVPARRLLPLRPSVLGGLYASSGRGTGSWATGRFVFAVRAAGYERWWAVEVVVDAIEDPATPAAPPRP